MLIGFIGFGLIGGSLAKGLKRANPHHEILAFSRTPSTLLQAREDGIVDYIAPDINASFSDCAFIFLCTPVHFNADYLRKLKPLLGKDTIVTDVGSTKGEIHRAVTALDMESVFIGGHPMAGSEKTGYSSATDHLLENAYYVLTPTMHTSGQALAALTTLVDSVGAIPLIMDPDRHDEVVATISHLPHLIAAELVNLVKATDDSRQSMKQLAAGGFKDITRIASSSPEMWEQICMSNQGPIVQVLDAFMDGLSHLRRSIAQGDGETIFQAFSSSRAYRSTFPEKKGGPDLLNREYCLHSDIVDKVGTIAHVTGLLAAHGINLKNLGILYNRETEPGVLRLEFYSQEDQENAHTLLNDEGIATIRTR